MKRVMKYMQSYLLFGLPFVITCMFWNNSIHNGILLKIFQELLAWHLMLWFLVLTFFLILLVVAPKARELTLRRLANIRERDEREEYITGRASRITYISTLSLMILLLFSTIFSINVKKLPNNQQSQGKHHALSLSLGFKFLDDQRQTKATQVNDLFDSNTVSLSKPAILLILIAWQLIAFNYSARKEQAKE